MAANIDWDKIEEDNKGEYKDYAPEGVYKTKIKEVVLREASTGSKGIEFRLADNKDWAFPKYGAVAWVSLKNDSWRIHHMKELFVVLGFTEDQARKAVEQAEAKEDKLAEAYYDLFKKALPKSKEVEIEVFYKNKDDEYTTWDFTSKKVRMNKPEKDSKAKKSDDLFDGATEVKDEVDLSDVPF